VIAEVETKEKDSKEPVWNEHFLFETGNGNQILKMSVIDAREGGDSEITSFVKL